MIGRTLAALAAALMLMVSSQDARAQDRPIFAVGNVGYAWDQPHGGISVNGGVGAGTSRVFAYLLPLDVTFVQGKQDRRYIQQSTIYGDQLCQDRQTGRYVSAGNCRVPVSLHWGGAAELNFAPMTNSGSFFAGAGYRTGYAKTAYGTIGYIGRATGRTFGLARLSIGSGFAQLAIGGHI
jgi:hypothetical protein